VIKRSDEEIWYWYERIEEHKKSGLGVKPWCDANSVEYKTMSNMIYRICWKSRTDPKTYEKIVPITKKFMQSGAPMSKFCKAHSVDIKLVSECATHLNYLEIIEKIKAEKEPKSMNFVQVAAPSSQMQSIQQGEILEKQNDIEIIIAKGVKVSISPNIDSMKIIKIIELLKDL
jgi:hypothetical protein